MEIKKIETNNVVNEMNEVKKKDNMITQVKPIEERIKLRYYKRYDRVKTNVQDFIDFGKYAAEKAYTEDYDKYIRHLKDIFLADRIDWDEQRAFWVSYKSNLKRDFVDIFDKLVEYLKDYPEDCELYLDTVLTDYVESSKECDRTSLHRYLTDMILDSLSAMISSVIGKGYECYSNCHIDDLIEELTEEEIEQCRFLHNLIKYNIGTYYLEHLLRKSRVMNYFLDQLI